MANKKNDRGKVIAQVDYLHIRQTIQYDSKLRKAVSSRISIYHGKQLVESGFKNKEEAMIKAQELVDTGFVANKYK